MTVETRFWSKVAKTETCWNWIASRDSTGYGHIKIDGKMIKAHRLSYEMHKGPIPPDRVVDHICHNRRCVNPKHLRLATVKQNAENRAGAQANNGSGIRGVTKVWRSNTWRAQLQHHGQLVYLGHFPTQEEASEAVIKKRLELFTHNAADRKAAPTGAALSIPGGNT